ncbi:unnamed protein product [Citrullus colocynthis]|uniref:Homeobox-leucine zipper protein n=1 Tax=Citrullus colocynthis TaxID=252529 RepID=A0ABP0XLB4_9ROSI
MASPHHSHSFMFQSRPADHHEYVPSASFNAIPSCPPHLYFHDGVVPVMMKRSMSFSGVENGCEEVNGDEGLSDDGLALGEKKKRLNLEQVKALEKSFELGNKLEPERKMQLAKALGLQPRQIAIWFQNRRARWKTKQLERDYEVLKKQFEALKADNDVLQAQNTKLHAELLALKTKDSGEAAGGGATMNLKKENERCWSSDNSCDINLDISKTQAPINGSGSGGGGRACSQPGIIKDLFPSAAFRSAAITQLLQHGSSRSTVDHPQVIQEESFSQMFNGIEEQQQTAAAAGFWPWSSDQNSHFH